MRALTLLPLALLAFGCTEYELDPGHNVNTGPQPDIEVDPTTLSWGVKLPDCPSDAKIVTVRNIGESRLIVSSLEITGDASAYDHLAPQLPIELATGEAFEIPVTFLAQTTIPYNASLLIGSNDPDEDIVAVTLTGEGGLNPSNEDVFQQAEPEAVDLLWVLDTSCSMSGVVAELETRFNEFINSFVALGLDYQIGATTSDMDSVGPGNQGTLLGPVLSSATMTQAEIVQGFDDQVNPTTAGSATEKVLGAAYDALIQPNGHGVIDGLVRPDANLAVIVVGDEDDQSSRGSQFYVDWMDSYKASPSMTSISAIIPVSTGGGSNIFNLDGCIDMLGMQVISGAVDGTGGEKQNLCELESSFAEIMDWLSFAAAGMSTSFDLSSTPAAGVAGMVVTVDGVSVPMDPFRTQGFSYNPQTNQVSFHGSAIPGPGADIVVTYPVSGECTTN